MSGILDARQELLERFAHHPPRDMADVDAHQAIRIHAARLAAAIDDAAPDSREKSLALTKVQEAMMWGNAAVAIHGARKQEAPRG